MFGLIQGMVTYKFHCMMAKHIIIRSLAKAGVSCAETKTVCKILNRYAKTQLGRIKLSEQMFR